MSRCIDVRNLCVYSGVTFSRSRLVEINMTRKQATIAVRSGLNDDEQYGCVVPPIHLSSTYNFIDFNQPRTHDYSRRGNPTRDVVQRALAELEGGAGAVMTSSGMCRRFIWFALHSYSRAICWSPRMTVTVAVTVYLTA